MIRAGTGNSKHEIFVPGWTEWACLRDLITCVCSYTRLQVGTFVYQELKGDVRPNWLACSLANPLVVIGNFGLKCMSQQVAFSIPTRQLQYGCHRGCTRAYLVRWLTPRAIWCKHYGMPSTRGFEHKIQLGAFVGIFSFFFFFVFEF